MIDVVFFIAFAFAYWAAASYGLRLLPTPKD